MTSPRSSRASARRAVGTENDHPKLSLPALAEIVPPSISASSAICAAVRVVVPFSIVRAVRSVSPACDGSSSIAPPTMYTAMLAIGAPIASIAVYIVGGAIEEEPSQAGLTLLTARTMLKGTTTRTAAQIAEDAEMLGGTISASAGSDSFGWSFSVPTARLAEALELLGDVIQRPTIPDDSFETERTVALSNVAMLRDDMFRYPMRLASSAAFAKHPYGVPPMGTEESLRALTAEQAREWHKSRVLESAIVIGVVADRDVKEIADLVAQEFGTLELEKPPKIGKPRWPKTVKIAAESRDKAQTAIALAFPAPSRTEEARFAANLIATVASGLGGRFFDELRDRQSLAYTVQAAASGKRLAGIFLSYIATSPEKEGVARNGLLAEFAKLRDAT